MQTRAKAITRKVILSLVSILLIFLILEYVILYRIVLPGFASLQTDNAFGNAKRCYDAITSELSHLDTLAYDWSAWDDTYKFVQDRNKAFLEANIIENVFSSGTFDMVFIINLKGEILSGSTYDPEKEEMVNLKEFNTESFSEDHYLLRHSSKDSSVCGLICTDKGLLMIASRPVITSEGKGPIRGVLIMGRFLNSAKIKRISDQVNVDFSITRVQRNKGNESYQIINRGDGEYSVHNTKNGNIEVVQQMDCLDGQTIAITSSTPDTIISKGRAIAGLSLLFGLGISSLCLVSVFSLLKRTLLKKIESICDFVSGITETGDLSVRAEVSGDSELDTLCESINNMLDTMEANEEQITQARIEAETASETKNLFLANMSHEIRTPMNAIIGFSDLLAEEDLSKEHIEYVDAIRCSGKNLLNLINDILDFSKIEAGKIDIDLNEYSLDEIIIAVETPMHSLAKTKGLNFSIKRQNSLPEKVYTDCYRLQQCLINLIGNAIKFTEQGHVFIKISSEHRHDQKFICFDIEDTGIGISEDKQRVIFDSFTQEDFSSTRVYGGTGLGLAITKQLVKLLGGYISLSSERGKGSVFSLIIPVGLYTSNQLYHDIAGEQSTCKIERRRTPRYKYSGRILVAEDVETNQILIKLLLNKMGFEVTVVEDGCRAIEKTQKEEFDMIFMDVHMPNVNGLESVKYTV